ncbi:MAG: rod shape-determining protein MreD [Oscillospiraceae bacterium]|nr:rod shape-determining protein MreD [Oscillospiraceae bacterium]
MKRQTRWKLLQWLVLGLEVFVLFFLSDTAGIFPMIAGAKPALLLCAAMSIALSGVGELTAMSFGILCGLLMDFSRGGPYGFHGAILAVLCYISASLVRYLFQKNLLSALLLTIVAIVLVFSLEWLFFYVVWGYPDPLYLLLHHYVPSAIYTLVLAVPVYFLTRGLSSVFQEK